MEPVQESISGHMQLDYMKMKQEMDHLSARALVGEHLLLLSWALTTTVSQDLTVLHGGLLLSTLMTHCGPLWDGRDCNGLEGTCCDPPNLPWFCKELPEPTTDYLEVRVCGDEPRTDNEDTPVDLVQLYIQ